MKRDRGMTRRGALQAGAAAAASVAVASALSSEAEAAAMQHFERQAAVDPKHRILLRGGTIISLDDKVGDLVRGDVLIEGKKIAAIAPELKAAGAQEIDARDCIIVPGFVDTH